MNLATEAIDGVEALVRWEHPDRGLLPPSAFLSEAEASGHVLPIDRWVLDQACHQVRTWQMTVPGAEHLCVHVNLSARHLQQAGIAETVAETLRSSGLAPEHLVLEITETTLVLDSEAAGAELARLKALNVQLALDDFGTGFSSLSHLVRFPIDSIKIDRSFVTYMGKDAKRSELALALVELGRSNCESSRRGSRRRGSSNTFVPAGVNRGRATTSKSHSSFEAWKSSFGRAADGGRRAPRSSWCTQGSGSDLGVRCRDRTFEHRSVGKGT